MKFKAALRYQANELLRSALGFCCIVGAVIVVVNAIFFAMSSSFQMSIPVDIMSFLVIVLLFLLPPSTFSDDMKFLLHMGLTRTQVYVSSATVFAATALFLALIEVACASMFGPSGRDVLVDFAWTFGANLTTVLVALALAIVHVKVGTRWLLAGLAAVVALVFVVVPAICTALYGSSAPLFIGLTVLFGISAAGVDLTCVLGLFVAAAVLAMLAGYLLVKRIEVRA